MIVGEKIKDNLTGEIFEVKKIVKEWVLFKGETSYRQCLTGLSSLLLLHEKAPEGTEFCHAGNVTNLVKRNAVKTRLNDRGRNT